MIRFSLCEDGFWLWGEMTFTSDFSFALFLHHHPPWPGMGLKEGVSGEKIEMRPSTKIPFYSFERLCRPVQKPSFNFISRTNGWRYLS